MKKTSRSYSAKALLAFVSIVAFTALSCEAPFGLGGQVDLSAPTIDIATPERDVYLSGDFTVSGSVHDDLAIQSVTIRLIDKDGGELGSFIAGITGDTYSILIPVATNQSLEGYSVIEAVVLDASGKSGRSTTSVSIDKKSPTVLVTSPLTMSPDIPVQSEYIDIKGEAFDRSPIASVRVSLLNNDGTVLAGPIDAEGTNTWTDWWLPV